MSAIHVARSFAYGFKVCLYWLAVVLVGGGGVALGAVLAWPEIQSWRSNGVVSTPELAGGAVLAVLGLLVLVSGLFGILYKLIADSVAEGRAADSDSQPADDVPAASADTDGKQSSTTTEYETAEESEIPESTEPVATTQASDHEESGAATEPQIETVERRSVDTGSSQQASRSSENQSTASADDDSSWTGEWEEGTKATVETHVQDEPPQQEEDLSSPDPTPSESTPARDDGRDRSGDSAPGEHVETGSPSPQPQPSAEEIAFGSTGETDEGQSTGDINEKQSTGDINEKPSTGRADEGPPIDDPADEATSTGAPEDETTSTETAGSPSSDPLADRGDDEK